MPLSLGTFYHMPDISAMQFRAIYMHFIGIACTKKPGNARFRRTAPAGGCCTGERGHA